MPTDTAESTPPAAPSRLSLVRRVLRLLRVLSAVVTALLLVLGLVGHVARARLPWLAALIYIPLVVLGPLAVMQDLLSRGRSLPVRRLPCLLGLLGVISATLSAFAMTGEEPERSVPRERLVTVVQWNVQWGGRGREGAWESMQSDIAGRTPDLIVLSEAPPAAGVEQLRTRLGQQWSSAEWADMSDPRYRFHLAVLSRWPLRSDARQDIAGGRAMTVTAVTDSGPLRVLVVDGMSNWHLPRTPRLRDVADICHSAAQRGQPIDVIAGDFNCVSRSVGFDAIEAGGYTLASRVSGGWRATWPSRLPLYDLDHVWVRRERPLLGCDFFRSAHSDHRGQVVTFAVGR